MSAYPAGVWQVQTRPCWGGVGQVLVRTSDTPTPDREHSSLSHANTDGFLRVWQPRSTSRWSRAGKCSGCHSQDSAGQQPTAERHLKKWTVSILVWFTEERGKGVEIPSSSPTCWFRGPNCVRRGRKCSGRGVDRSTECIYQGSWHQRISVDLYRFVCCLQGMYRMAPILGTKSMGGQLDTSIATRKTGGNLKHR